jgi:hypothetical protein
VTPATPLAFAEGAGQSDKKVTDVKAFLEKKVTADEQVQIIKPHSKTPSELKEQGIQNKKLIEEAKARALKDEDGLAFEAATTPVYDNRATLNAQQLPFCDSAIKDCQQIVEDGGTLHTPRERALLLLHGGPGVGKSHVIRTFVPAARKLGLGVACCAYSGVAAAGLELGGQTIHNLMGFGIQGKTAMNSRCYMDLARSGNKQTVDQILREIDVLVVDEISMVDADSFGNMDSRCRDARSQLRLKFGGMQVILVGDFFQLPPTTKSGSLYDSAMKMTFPDQLGDHDKKPTESRNVGTETFLAFKKTDLTIQQRARNDNDHLKLIEQLRDPLHADQPIDDWVVSLMTKRCLSKNDVQTYPEWSTAPIAITANAERSRLNLFRATHFCSGNEPYVTWDVNISGDKVKLFVNEDDDKKAKEILSAICSSNPELIGIFIRGAPAYLTENIAVSRGLCNGSSVRFHSLSFENQDEEEVERALEQIREGKAGERVHINIAPTYIHVELSHGTCAYLHWPDEGTLVDGKIVFPVGLEKRTEKIFVGKVQRLGACSVGYVDAKVHAVQPQIAMTNNKLQGCSVKRILVEANHRPFQPPLTFSAFYVGVTRTTDGKNGCRFIPPTTHKGFEWLKKLKPPKNLHSWLAGYDKDGTWSADRAREHASKNSAAKRKPNEPPSTMSWTKKFQSQQTKDQTAAKRSKKLE